MNANPQQSPQPTSSPHLAAPTTVAEPGVRGLWARTTHDPRSIFIGGQGLRSGWSLLIFMALLQGLSWILDKLANRIQPLSQGPIAPVPFLLVEGGGVVALIALGMLMARIEGRRLRDYNLSDARGGRHFVEGMAWGFSAVSLLVGGLYAGGWIRFAPVSLHGMEILKFGALWAIGALFIGLLEEGTARCYLLFTLERGINLWWAAGSVAAMCLGAGLNQKGLGAWGFYGFAILGLIPCAWSYFSKFENTNFWCAAWVTSAFFGLTHTGNGGESWIGIFAAAAGGLVFCLSVRLTGSAWWAIGCHATWDWAQSFFYGTADSGIEVRGHLLTSVPIGNRICSGGQTGPEGSALILPVLTGMLLALFAVYGRTGGRPSPQIIGGSEVEQVAG